MAEYFDVLRRLLVLVYLVNTLFIFNVCCVVIVQVTRNKMDTFTYSPDETICDTGYDSDICKTWNAKHFGEKIVNKINGLCSCICSDSTSFLESNLSCVPNIKMRNKSYGGSWPYRLPGIVYIGAPLAIKPPSTVNLIKFEIKVYNDGRERKNCNPYKVELTGKRNWIQINKFILNKTVNELPVSPEGGYRVANLILNWKEGEISSIHGRLMRIWIKCHYKQKHFKPKVDDFIIFKINGTLSVNNITEGTSTLSSFISPIPSTIIGTTQVSSIVSTASASYQQHSVRTSFSALYKSTSSSALYESTSFSLISPTIMSSSSANSSSPEKQSKDSSAKAVLAGAVIGTVVALVIAFLIIFYILRKRKKKQGNLDPGGFNNAMANKNCPSHVLDNPLSQDEAYIPSEGVEKCKKRKSGVNIDNANYEQCLVVENLSARNTISSVYDNVPQQKSEDEHAYNPLDPTKRDPSSKYQSLIHPENEYCTISDDTGSTPLQEPVYYSTVDDKAPKNLNAKPDPVYNVLEANDSTVQTPSDPVYNVLERSNGDKGKQQPVYNVLEQSNGDKGKQQPVYNVLEQSNGDKGKQEPVYNVLERSNGDKGKQEPVYNVLELSGEIQGKQEPVYSELGSK